ncbi:carbohydrate ABC transporter permease [Paenibacillus koleovorans]|uniref:carbohydrate ABC transporter permease n=1 Tax=Paenibacillus koleovorans TaxID=121608 RepID=UPI0035A25F41
MQAANSKGSNRSLGEWIFESCNYLLFTLMGALTIIPFLNLLAKSLSGESAVISGQVGLIPVDWQLSTYKYVLQDSLFIRSFLNSVIITGSGVALSMLMTILAAYPLSKPRLVGRKGFILLYIFTMIFSGGLIPTYLLMQNLHLNNTLFALFLPAMINVYNLLIVKNYFESLPDSLEESAKLDGASNVAILFRIVVPLSLPVLATIALFYAVAFWNDYFNAMIYITKTELKPMQLYLKELLVSSNDEFLRSDNKANIEAAMNLTPQSIQAASILLTTLPIVLVYPFLQKYFVKGVMIGSVKG